MLYPELAHNFVQDVVMPQLERAHLRNEPRKWTCCIVVDVKDGIEPRAPFAEDLFMPVPTRAGNPRYAADVVLHANPTPLHAEPTCVFRTVVHFRIDITREPCDERAFYAVFVTTRLCFVNKLRERAFRELRGQWVDVPEITTRFASLSELIVARPRIFIGLHDPVISGPRDVDIVARFAPHPRSARFEALRADDDAKRDVAESIFTRLQDYIGLRVPGFIADNRLECEARERNCIPLLK